MELLLIVIILLLLFGAGHTVGVFVDVLWMLLLVALVVLVVDVFRRLAAPRQGP